MKLYDYQRQAVHHLQSHPRAGLFLDMGLGKTASVLSALQPEDLPALVVAPKRVAETVWSEEGALWRPDLSMALAIGSPTRRQGVLANQAHPVDIVVIGRDNLHQAVEFAPRYRTFILDELSGFKTHKSRRTKAAIKIADQMNRVIGMTGTPAPNGYIDLWSEMRILDRGERLGKHLTPYRQRYFVPQWPLPNGVIPGWDLRPGAAAAIDRKIADICLSMGTEGRIQLPPVTYNRVPVPMPTSAWKVYRDMKETLVSDLDLVGGSIHSAANAAVLSGKLSQITAGFLYNEEADGVDILHHAKADALQEIIDGTGSPVLVFYRFREEARQLLTAIKGSEPMKGPDTVKRWNAGQIPVLLAHPASAGHGLNLQHGGHTIVWTTPTWSLEERMQANKRLARNGQKHPVVIHDLEVPDSIDGAILRAVDGKKTVQQALLDYLEGE